MIHCIFQVYILKLMMKLYNEVSWNVSPDSDNILDNYSQISIIGWACKYGLEHCVHQAVNQLSEWRKAVERDGIAITNP